ncbi:MAG: hypothetical protein QOD80_1778 [Verrucomicrobiota bacterium]
MELRLNSDRLIFKPMARQLDRVPAVVHQNSASGNGRVAAPVWMRRINRGAILDPPRLYLKLAQFSNRTGSERIRRSANDRRILPIVDRNNDPT